MKIGVTKIPNRTQGSPKFLTESKFMIYQIKVGDYHLKWMIIIDSQAIMFTPSFFSWNLNAFVNLTKRMTQDHPGD